MKRHVTDEYGFCLECDKAFELYELHADTIAKLMAERKRAHKRAENKREKLK